MSPNELHQHSLSSSSSVQVSSVVDFCCGWGSACIETFITFPLNKLIFRQQLHGVIINEAIGQMSKEGFRHIYRGLLPPLIQKTSSRALMFGMYEQYMRIFDCNNSTSSTASHACRAAAAFSSGATEAILCPLERVQALLQSKDFYGRFRNTLHAFRELRSYGLSEYYRGASAIVFRNGSCNILFFSFRTPLQHYISDRLDTISPKANKESTSARPRLDFRPILASFASGAVLGATVSTLFFPVNVVKTRMQSKLGGKFNGMISVFRIIWNERERSLSLLYRGVHLNFTRSLLTWGITNAVYECLIMLFSRNFKL